MSPAQAETFDPFSPSAPNADTSIPSLAQNQATDWTPLIVGVCLIGALYYMHVNNWEGIEDVAGSAAGAGLRLIAGTAVEKDWQKTLGNSGQFRPFARTG